MVHYIYSGIWSKQFVLLIQSSELQRKSLFHIKLSFLLRKPSLVRPVKGVSPGEKLVFPTECWGIHRSIPSSMNPTKSLSVLSSSFTPVYLQFRVCRPQKWGLMIIQLVTFLWHFKLKKILETDIGCLKKCVHILTAD